MLNTLRKLLKKHFNWLGSANQFLVPSFSVLLFLLGLRGHSWAVKLIFQSAQLLSDCTVSQH